jgi:RHS repeat-associated protein
MEGNASGVTVLEALCLLELRLFDVGRVSDWLEHMNGRVFDPYFGRFLSGDSVIQDLSNPQAFNRYSYCINSPMMCTDPSGQIFGIDDFLFAAIVLVSSYGAEQAGIISQNTFNLIAGVTVAWVTGPIFGNSLLGNMASGFAAGLAGSGGDLRAAGLSAVTAGIFNMAGNVGAFAGESSAAAYGAQAVAGCVSGELQGGGCGRGAMIAVATHGVGNFANGLSDGEKFAIKTISGGTISTLSGGKFSNGALTAAFQYLYNDTKHEGGIGAQAAALGVAPVALTAACEGMMPICIALGASVALDQCQKNPDCLKGIQQAVNSASDEASRQLNNAQKALGNLMDKAAAESKTGRQEYVYTLRAERNGDYLNVRTGETQYLNKGDVWKIGTSYDTDSRYSQSQLGQWGVVTQIESTGTKYQTLVTEKLKLINYFSENGQLPPGNKIFK